MASWLEKCPKLVTRASSHNPRRARRVCGAQARVT